MANFLVLNGPNLNLLGSREPELYGDQTLKDIENGLAFNLIEAGHSAVWKQSNHEGELIDWVHQALTEKVDCIVFNPAAYTHTSIALRDALLAVGIPFVEVHLTDPSTREDFRRHSYFNDIAVATIQGHGPESYKKAFEAAQQHLTTI